MNLFERRRGLLKSVGGLVKLIVTAANGIVSFVTNVVKPTKITCEFSPVQAGTGDPSPSNVRPISGWTGCEIYNETQYNAQANPKLSVSWQSEAGTVYGGTLTINEDGTGTLVKTHHYVKPDVSSFTNFRQRTVSNNIQRFLVSYPNLPTGVYAETNIGVCNVMPFRRDWNTYDTHIYVDTNFTFFVPTSWASITNLTTFKSWLNSLDSQLEIAYTIGESDGTTYNLTASQVNSLIGNNTIWHDMNGAITVEYYNKQ